MNNTEISAEARQQRNEYQRQWRRRNPGKLKEYQNRYWQRLYEQQRMPARKADKGQLELILPVV